MKVCERCGARFRGDPDTCPLDGGELVAAPDPLIGRTIGGRYVIEEKIGAGGMGIVYRARHDVVGRDVAIKFLAPELAHDSKNRTRFLREARAANRINHEHIIDITDYGETDEGHVYLVMEYLDGAPLDAEIRKGAARTGAMRPQRALRIALQACLALGRAHELGVVHRDVKPENVFLVRSDAGDFVKLLDFGLAHMRGELRVTATGTVFGTPEYIPPEQARGASATPAADLYALGCMIYEMITGRLPFDGSTTQLILKHMRETPQPPSWHVPGIPEGVDRLVLDLLEKDPERRPANAYRLAERIRGLLLELGEDIRRTDRPQPAGRSQPAPEHVRDTVASEAAGPAGTPTQGVDARARTISMEDSWQQRVEMLRVLFDQTYAEGDAPPWLEPAVEHIEVQLAEVARIRSERTHCAQQAAQREDDVRQLRLRIGRALDELARDQAQIADREAEVRRRIADAERDRAELSPALLQQWRALPSPPSEPQDLQLRPLEPLARAGELATRWMEAARTLGELAPEVERLEREAVDLRFQIGQLKGRLASINAESDYDAGGLKEEAVRLDRELHDKLEQLVKDAEPVVRHFKDFPQWREVVGSTGASSGGRAAQPTPPKP